MWPLKITFTVKQQHRSNSVKIRKVTLPKIDNNSKILRETED